MCLGFIWFILCSRWWWKIDIAWSKLRQQYRQYWDGNYIILQNQFWPFRYREHILQPELQIRFIVIAYVIWSTNLSVLVYLRIYSSSLFILDTRLLSLSSLSLFFGPSFFEYFGQCSSIFSDFWRQVYLRGHSKSMSP